MSFENKTQPNELSWLPESVVVLDILGPRS